jgi:hypothetical protein
MTFDPTDPETRQCPYPHYERMRADDPVCWVESTSSSRSCATRSPSRPAAPGPSCP